MHKSIVLVAIFFVHVISFRLDAQIFNDVASQMGIVTNFSSSEIHNYTFGSGVSFYDFNQNGWDDLTFAIENDSILFYQNNQGVFEKAGSFVFGDGQVKHVLWVDYDNDGHLDLFVTSYNHPYRLYRNDGNFNFEDVTETAGLSDFVQVKSYGASFGDYTRNGYLDLYVCKYHVGIVPETPGNLNQLYRNNGDGTFTNVTQQAGVGDGTKASFQSVWIDYDLDGWPDLFVINDFDHANSLYRNNGDGTFTDVSEQAGIQFTGEHPMSVTVGDYNNNGLLDIFMSNSGEFVEKPAILMHNNGDGTFTDTAAAVGVDNNKWSWGATWIDYNNNSFQDLFVTTGVITSLYNQVEVKNYFYENVNGQYFTDASGIFTPHDTVRSFAVARGDFTNNGYYDLVVHNNTPDNAYLYQNSGGANNYIKITLEGTVSNRMAIGSWIRVFAGGSQYTQYTFCGENYLGQNSQHHIFGLGQDTIVDSVQITYSLGHVDTYYNLNVNQHYFFKEGETWDFDFNLPNENYVLCAGDTLNITLEIDSTIAEVIWNTGDTVSQIDIISSGAYWATIKSIYGVEFKTDTVSTYFVNLPVIEHDIQHVSCYDGSDGQITLNLYLSNDTFQIIWHHNTHGQMISNLASGKYAYTLESLNGCVHSDSVEILQPLPLNVQKMITDETAGNQDGRFQFVINGGTPPYTAMLNGNSVESPVENLSAGTYLLEVIDDNGCIINEEITVSALTAITEIQENLFTVYPNPNQGGYLMIESSHPIKNLNIAVYNTFGQVVFEQENHSHTNGKSFINLSALANGVYVIHLKNNEYTYTQRLHIIR